MMLHVIIPSWDPVRAQTLAKQLAATASGNPAFPFMITPAFPAEDGYPQSRLLLPILESAVSDLSEGPGENIYLFCHDDLEVQPGWETLTMAAFEDHKVGLVGWGGATGLGHKDIYKMPYQLTQLAREGYASATTDWKEHGDLLTAPREVAVLDGFCLAFRREAYEEMGGWQAVADMGAVFHFYDTISCLLMRRLGWKVMAVPVPCRHLGGRTSTTPEYQELLRSLGYENDLEVHARTSRMVYEKFRSELPVRVA